MLINYCFADNEFAPTSNVVASKAPSFANIEGSFINCDFSSSMWPFYGEAEFCVARPRRRRLWGTGERVPLHPLKVFSAQFRAAQSLSRPTRLPASLFHTCS